MSLKNNAVLLLNNSYEPIGTISIKKAFINWFNGKYYIEEYQNKEYRSQNQEHKVPSVVRLKHYIPINKRRRASATKRTRIYIRDKFKCAYCGNKYPEKELTLDHIIPKARGGQNESENLATCCFSCNQKKGFQLLEECGMKLLHPPAQLQVGLDKVVVGHWGDLRPSWKKYLFLSDEGDRTHRE